MNLDYLKTVETVGEDDGYDFGSEPISSHFQFGNVRTRLSELGAISHGCGAESVVAETLFHHMRPYENGYNPTDGDRCELEYCEHCGWWNVKRRISENMGRFAYWTKRVNCSGIPMSFEERETPAVSEIAKLLREGHKQLDHTSPKLLEQALAEIFKSYYSASEVHHIGGPNDQGIDVFAVSGDHTFLIQVKRRVNGKAEAVSTVRDLIGAYALADATITTTGHSAHIITSAPSISMPAVSAVERINLSKFGFRVTAHGFDELSEIVGLATGTVAEPWQQIVRQWEPFKEEEPKIIPHTKLHRLRSNPPSNGAGQDG